MSSKNYLSLIILLLLMGCKKKEQVSPLSIYDLIVDGGITTYSTDQYIRLSTPGTLPKGKPKPISNAIVIVNDGVSDIPFTEIPGTGVYTAIVKNNTNFDEAYTLKITYNDKEYTAVDTLRKAFEISTTYIPLTVALNGANAKVTIPKHIFGAVAALRWLIDKEGTIWEPKKFNVKYPFNYAHSLGSPNALDPLLLKNKILDLNINDSLTVYKYSLSERYSTFIYNLFQETEWRGVFSVTPENIKGNIIGDANGYFYAMDVGFKKIAIKDLLKN